MGVDIDALGRMGYPGREDGKRRFERLVRKNFISCAVLSYASQTSALMLYRAVGNRERANKTCQSKVGSMGDGRLKASRRKLRKRSSLRREVHRDIFFSHVVYRIANAKYLVA